MDRRELVVVHEDFPRGAVLARLCEGKPRLDVLAGGAGVVAGRQKIEITRATAADRPSALFAGQVDDGSQITDPRGHLRRSLSLGALALNNPDVLCVL
jgi:hypothetical protein